MSIVGAEFRALTPLGVKCSGGLRIKTGSGSIPPMVRAGFALFKRLEFAADLVNLFCVKRRIES